MEKKNINHCLDWLKGIACIGVVFGHALFPGTFGHMVYTFAKAMVPIFFLISGYFSYCSDVLRIKERTPKKIVHALKLYLYALGIYFVWIWIKVLLNEKTVNQLLRGFSINNMVKFFTLNDVSMFDGSHLWFLGALLYCYIILYLLACTKKVNWIFPVILLTFIARLYAVNMSSWHMSQNFLLAGVPYFFTGFFFKKIELEKKDISKLLLSAGILFGVILGECGFFYYGFTKSPLNIYEIGIIIMGISMFILALKVPNFGENTKTEILGFRYSLYVYIEHFIVLELLTILDGKIFDKYPIWYQWIKPLIVVALAIFIAHLCYEIKNKKIEKKER